VLPGWVSSDEWARKTTGRRGFRPLKRTERSR
jgi:hypothetical protein